MHHFASIRSDEDRPVPALETLLSREPLCRVSAGMRENALELVMSAVTWLPKLCLPCRFAVLRMSRKYNVVRISRCMRWIDVVSIIHSA